ncbi:MAG: pyridoxal phosphate-dependent aminotransferase [Candidatus Kapabacteria bacterium]|nr:pyridoxal phosphate-dependent aminotransferase [Candidatus Kapabacteria bacterium]
MDVQLSDIAIKFHNQISPVREIMNYADPNTLEAIGVEPKDFISFGGGWVNHKAPKGYQNAYLEIINNDQKFHYAGGYSPTPGERYCKEAIIAFESEIYGMKDLQPEEILIGQSSTQLTFFLFKILLNKNDKIMMLDPSYCNYPLQNNIFKPAELIEFPVIDSDFNYIANEPETIKNVVEFIDKEKPKVVLLVSPDNPTGGVLSDEFVNSVYEEVSKYGGVVVMDFAYKSLNFCDTPKYFSKKPDGNFITIHSNSKWGRNLGRRLGWLEAPEYIIKAFETFQSATMLCPDRMHQMAFTDYVNNSIKNGELKKYIEETKKIYKETSEVTINAIQEFINLPLIKPMGGIYIVVKVFENSAKFVQKVLKNTGVLFIPGWGFGSTLTQSVRISYGPLIDNHKLIIEGMKRVGDFLKNGN